MTDLAEERLMTDANEPDTDGDGLGDAADPLPHVAHVEDEIEDVSFWIT